MFTTLISVAGTLLGTLLGAGLGYLLSLRQSERHFRRIVLRDIAFEYRCLANSRQTGGVQGLIRAGIHQCQNDREYMYVVDLIDDLSPVLKLGDNWRPRNGKYVEFFARLKTQGRDPTSTPEMLALKKEVEALS
jgi:hypothetical protein